MDAKEQPQHPGLRPVGVPQPDWGRYTQNGKWLYAHIYERGIGPLNLPRLGRADQARPPAGQTAPEIKLERPLDDDRVSRGMPSSISRAAALPDGLDTVVALELILTCFATEA